MKIRKRDIPKTLLKAFPNYRGRTYHLEVTKEVTLANAYWSGGTKSYYVAVNLATGEVQQAGSSIENPFRTPYDQTVEIPPNVVIVSHDRFCGKDMGLRFYVRPENVPPTLKE